MMKKASQNNANAAVGVATAFPSRPICPSDPSRQALQSSGNPRERNSSNVFESLSTQSFVPKAKSGRVMTVDPRRSQPNSQPMMHSWSQRGRESAPGPSAPKKAKIQTPILQRNYEIGTVVMAKYLKYSYWPAIVVKRPIFSINRSLTNGRTR